LFDNFGQYLVQHYFAALDKKRFLFSDIVKDSPLAVVTDMHVPTLARMDNVLQLRLNLFLTCANLCQFFVILLTLHSFATTYYFAE